MPERSEQGLLLVGTGTGLAPLSGILTDALGHGHSGADLKGWRVFICGHPEMVNQMKKTTFLKGASMKDIYTDAFHLTPV